MMLGSRTRLGLFGYGVSRNTSFVHTPIAAATLATVSMADGVVTVVQVVDGVVTGVTLTEWPA